MRRIALIAAVAVPCYTGRICSTITGNGSSASTVGSRQQGLRAPTLFRSRAVR